MSAVAILCLTHGCAELRWHRSGSDAAALERDVTECRQLARADTAHLAWPFPDSRIRVLSVDRVGRPLATLQPYPSALDTDRMVLQFERVSACMRDKGYALAPAETRARNGAAE